VTRITVRETNRHRDMAKHRLVTVDQALNFERFFRVL